MINVGTIDVDYRRDRDTRKFDLDGPVERLSLRAERSDVRCRDVSAEFADGRMHRIFSGNLQEGRVVNVDMPGAAQTVRRLQFSCGAEGRRGAKIQIAADIGRYRSAWERSPRWNSLWAGLFGAAAGRNGPDRRDQWQRVGRETFSGQRDVEKTSLGWRGNRVDAIALMPEGGNARCSRVTADFGNGRNRNLDLRRDGFLPRNQYTMIDLPGDARNLDGLRLRCRSVEGWKVTIGIYVRK